MGDDDAARATPHHDEALAQTTPALARSQQGARITGRGRPESLQADDVVAGRYSLKRYLAAGGMGEVWEAEDLTLKERVALKTIRPDRFSDEALRRFQSEVKLARRLSHRHLCRIFEFGQHTLADGTVISFLTMELLRGRLLLDVIRERGGLPVPEALVILEQLAQALDAAHEAGVVHRDFKSPNVFLEDTDGGVRAVVTDFGLARDVDAESRITTDTRLLMGTPTYMAPEQVEGAEVGKAADLYALGVVAFELVTAQAPFTGTSSLAVAMARLNAPPRKVSSLNAAVPSHWDLAFEVALARKPEDRFRSAKAFVDALKTPGQLSRWRGRTVRRATRAAAVVTPLILLVGAGLSLNREKPTWVDPCPNGVCPPWSGNLSGSLAQDQVESVGITPSGDVLISGRASGGFDLGCGPYVVPSNERSSGIVAKLNRSGLCQWHWVSSEDEWVWRLFVTGSGRTLVSAGHHPLDGGAFLSRVLEFDESGRATPLPTQGAANPWVSMTVDSSERVVVVRQRDEQDPSSSPRSLELVRLRRSGDADFSAPLAEGSRVRVLWMESDARGDLGLIGAFRDTVTFSGGQTFTSKGGDDMFLLKVSGTDGHVLWARAFGTEADESQDLGLIADAEGNWYGVGEHGGVDFGQGALTPTIYVVKFSPDGEALWSKGFGGSTRRDAARRVVIDPNGNPIVFGRFVSPKVRLDDAVIDNVAGSDLYLLRLDAKTGAVLGVKTYPAVDAPARGLAVHPTTGAVVIGGRFDQQLSLGQAVYTAEGQDGYFGSLGVVP
jgi:serine/threonine protein kinase